MHRTSTRKIDFSFPILVLLLSPLSTTGTTAASVIQTNTQSLESIIQVTPTDPSIQTLIDHAPPNTTLHLTAGTYTEILSITKPLHLQGDGPTHTILQTTSSPNGYAIRITANGATLTGFTITNQAPGLYATGVKLCAEHTTIQNCTFQNTPIGIADWGSQNTITGCDFHDCNDEGIVLLGTAAIPCTHTTISKCSFHNNCDGIELQYTQDTLIDSCTFTANTHAGIDAINTYTTNTTLSTCMFHDNQGYGLYLAEVTNTQISSCTFSTDAITLIHATETTFQHVQVIHIALMKDSTLILTDCDTLTPSSITTEQSTYEIHTNHLTSPTQENPQVHSLLLTILCKYPFLKVLYNQLIQLRM
jgi:parallel beta-helix repeat protein